MIHPEGECGVLPEEQHPCRGMEPIGKRKCIGQSRLEVDCRQPWQERGPGGNQMGDTDGRVAAGEVGYSKPNQGEHRGVRL